MNENHLVEMRGICKYFPGVKALQNVDFTLRPGEVHALMGENGAGKSTLIKVLTGVYEKDGGDIYLQGNDGAVSIRSPQDAQDLGIATVYQEITLCPNLTVAENMYIGRGHKKTENWKKMYADADAILQNLGIPRQRQAAARQLLDRHAADGGHRPRGGHGLQGPHPRRAPPRRSTSPRSRSSLA